MTATGDFEVVAAGIGFTEGPLWTRDGRLLVTSMSRGLVYGLDLKSRPGPPIQAIETGGGPNGLAEAADCTIYVAQNGAATGPSRSARPVTASLQAIIGDQVIDLTATDDLSAPNDLVVGPDGRVWFTDPDGATPRRLGGRLCAYDPATGLIDILSRDIDFPNGLAFHPETGDLYVADTTRDLIVRFAMTDGRFGEMDVFAEVPGSGPDGIAFDAEGKCYIAAFDSNEVVILDPTGRVERRLATGDRSRPTNLCFAGDDFTTLVVTLASGGRVVAWPEPLPGADAAPWLGRA